MLLLAAAAMMAGCSKESVVDSDNNQPSNLIGFKTYKTVSRGNPVDNNPEFISRKSTFGVTAFISTSDVPYMGTTDEGVGIISDGTSWGYVNPAEKAFWPTGGETLDFYAYYPHKHGSISEKAFSKNGGIAFTYSVPAAEADQVDLMFASAKEQVKSTDGKGVMMKFNHALTQVHFKVATKTELLKVDIEANGIKIHNICSKGRFAIPTDNENGWNNNPDVITNYTVTSGPVTGTFVGYGTDDSPIKFEQVGSPDQALMLIPQKITPWAPADNETTPGDTKNGYLSVSCKIYQMLANGTDKTYLVGAEDSFATIYVPFSSKKDDAEVWNRSKKVTYNLLIGEGSMLPSIEFETNVEPWVPVDGGSVENK